MKHESDDCEEHESCGDATAVDARAAVDTAKCAQVGVDDADSVEDREREEDALSDGAEDLAEVKAVLELLGRPPARL